MTKFLLNCQFWIRREASPGERSTSGSDDSADFRRRLDDEAGQEYFDFEGKFRDFDGGNFSEEEESYDDWADRIFSQYWRKVRPPVKSDPETSRKDSATSEPPKKTLKLKPVEKKEKVFQRDIYLVKFAKLFQSAETLTLSDLPFRSDSSAEEIIGTILWKDEAESRKRCQCYITFFFRHLCLDKIC
jgi:hypothetical protein